MIYPSDPIGTLLGQWAVELNTASILFRIALSVLFAAVIGWERSSKRHSAGLRTFLLMSLASTAAMLLDVFLAGRSSGGLPLLSAASVIAGAVISVNSVLFSSRSQIKGLTTSVGLWVCGMIGLALGADVPFFLHGSHAWAEGVGEQLQSIALPPAHVLVLKPSQGINTAQLFQNPLVRRDSPPATIASFAADPYGFGRNDLQAAAEQLCPQVAECLAWLRGHGLKGRMTGSGSATFALVPEAKLPAFKAALPQAPHGWVARLCSTLERHPLWRWVSETG